MNPTAAVILESHSQLMGPDGGQSRELRVGYKRPVRRLLDAFNKSPRTVHQTRCARASPAAEEIDTFIGLFCLLTLRLDGVQQAPERQDENHGPLKLNQSGNSSSKASETASGRWTGKSCPAPETIRRATKLVKCASSSDGSSEGTPSPLSPARKTMDGTVM